MSVEITDIVIPENLEDAMSKVAKTERKKESRVIPGSAEVGKTGRQQVGCSPMQAKENNGGDE